MTKYFDWSRFKEMTPQQKAGITTESTFSEQRAEDKEKPPKDFGIKQMEEEVNINWGKAVQPEKGRPNPQRILQKLAIADYKGEEMKDEEAANEALEPEPDK